MNTAFWILVGAGGVSVLYGVARAVRWVINDTNSYYEQCRIDEIDKQLWRDGLCVDCGKPNDRKDAARDDLPQYCSQCL